MGDEVGLLFAALDNLRSGQLDALRVIPECGRHVYMSVV